MQILTFWSDLRDLFLDFKRAPSTLLPSNFTLAVPSPYTYASVNFGSIWHGSHISLYFLFATRWLGFISGNHYLLPSILSFTVPCQQYPVEFIISRHAWCFKQALLCRRELPSNLVWDPPIPTWDPWHGTISPTSAYASARRHSVDSILLANTSHEKKKKKQWGPLT